MGDLEEDTTIERIADGRYRACVSAEWALWGPVGGYLAAIALRAAGAQAAMPLPVSLSCQYLAPARFDPVEIEIDCLRASPHAKALHVRMTQRDTVVLHGLVWTIADDIPGPERRLAEPPDVPRPDEVEVMPLNPKLASGTAATATATGTFWKNLEVRTLAFDETRSDGQQVHSWAKFRPRAYFDDPWLDACRELITIDTAIFPAVAIALNGGRYAALSMDLYVAFHSPPPAEDYLLVTAQSTAAGAGLVSGTAQTRSLDGTLTASGASQLLCRKLGA